MSRDIKESDWKQFKVLYPIALERYFQRAVAAMAQRMGDERKSNRDRFWEICEQARHDQKEVEEVFDGYRRSRAIFVLAAMRREGLIKEEEMVRFSAELRELIGGWMRLGNG